MFVCFQSSGDELEEFEVEIHKEGKSLGINIAGLVKEDTGGKQRRMRERERGRERRWRLRGRGREEVWKRKREKERKRGRGREISKTLQIMHTCKYKCHGD